MLSPYRNRGIVYRAHHPQWAFDPISGEGAALHGGRFNRPGVAAPYTVTSIMGAIAEAAQGMILRVQPLTIVSYQVDHAAVLDLSTPGACAAAGVGWDPIACDWDYLAALGKTVPSWELARELRNQRVGAIRVPSFAVGAQRNDTNLTFWAWSSQTPTQVLMIDNENLPRDRRSWS